MLRWKVELPLEVFPGTPNWAVLETAPPSGQALCSHLHLQVAALQLCAVCRPLMKLKRKLRKANAFLSPAAHRQLETFLTCLTSARFFMTAQVSLFSPVRVFWRYTTLTVSHLPVRETEVQTSCRKQTFKQNSDMWSETEAEPKPNSGSCHDDVISGV